MTADEARAEELALMAHRYLYYVECAPVISDAEYDARERAVLPLLPESSALRAVGSSLGSSYTAEQVEMAGRIR
jgi:NAD-dependent DNA ligase